MIDSLLYNGEKYIHIVFPEALNVKSFAGWSGLIWGKGIS